MPKKRPQDAGRAGSPVLTNSRARRQYEIIERIEAGISLEGPEVKSLREGNASLAEAYARFRDGELWLLGFHIDEYHDKGYARHEPTRPRKLLLRKRELEKLQQTVQRKGLTLVPLRLYWNERQLAKVELGLGRGRKLHDKRQVAKERDAKRDMQRAQRARR
jgi:SsrA-binding protein